jgi:hypothetical protein
MATVHESSGIFICYRREDSAAYAGRLYDRLTAQFGAKRIFMDIDTIEPGEDFVHAIQQTISSCDAVIVVIGKTWLSAPDDEGGRRIDNPEDFVHIEIAAALDRGIRVIPALVGGARPLRSNDLPEQLARLARRNAIEISDLAFHQNAGRLVEVLGRVLAQGEQARKEEAAAKKRNRLPIPAAPKTTPPVQSGPEPTATEARKKGTASEAVRQDPGPEVESKARPTQDVGRRLPRGFGKWILGAIAVIGAFGTTAAYLTCTDLLREWLEWLNRYWRSCHKRAIPVRRRTMP